MPSQVPYCTLISNHPLSFPASFNPSHCLSFTAFSLFHSNVLTFVSLSLSGSHALTLNLTLTALLPTHVSHASTMASQLALSTSQFLVKWVLLSSLILFLSSLIFSFHPFIPFIALLLSCCLSKPCPVAVPCITGHCVTPLVSSSSTVQLPSHVSPAPPQLLLKATCLLHIDHIAHPHWPHAIAPCLEWATIGPHYCTDHVPTVISSFSFTTFPLFPSSTTFLPLCSPYLNYHSLSCH